jgi:membrane associated rhomboid family serine protease
MLPPVTQALLIANVLGFLLENVFGGNIIQWFALWPAAEVQGLPWLTPWQLVTYSFLHASITHLAFNMFALWMFGADLERVWGPRRFLLTYFLGVLFGAFAQLLIGLLVGTNGAPTVGASAGIFGVLLAFALVFPDRTIMPLIPPIPMPARVFVLLYALLELGLGVTGSEAGVAHFAHLGGLVGGWLGYYFGGGSGGRRATAWVRRR